MEIILLIAALICAAASVLLHQSHKASYGAALSLSRCLRALDAREGADWRELTEPELDALCERAAREQRRFEEALSGILAYGEADMRRRPGEEV